MAITKEELLTVLNARLARSETDIDEEIRSALYDLSELALWPDLWTSDTSQTLASGDVSLSHPSDFRILDKIILNDGSNDGRPLTLIDGGFDQYLKRKEDESSTDYDEPLEYTPRGTLWYLDPTADGAYTTVIYYWKYATSLSSIDFSEPFREAIYNAVMMKYLEGKGLAQTPKFAEKAQLYLRETTKLLPRADRPNPVVAYRDI